jgi:hypothetical protein
MRWSKVKAVQPLRDEYGENWKPHAHRILNSLTVDAFHGTLEQSGEDFDVYGVTYDGLGWYVKLRIEDVLDENSNAMERLFTISCHRLNAPLRTNTGEVTP